MRSGTAAQVSMNGTYQFNLFAASPFAERDDVVAERLVVRLIAGADEAVIDGRGLQNGERLLRHRLRPIGVHDGVGGLSQDARVSPTPVRNAVFTPDGKHLVTANGDTTLYLLELP